MRDVCLGLRPLLHFIPIIGTRSQKKTKGVKRFASAYHHSSEAEILYLK